MAGTKVTRGEIWLIDLGMAHKQRPAVVMSVAFEDHERALVTYVPRTTSRRDTRFEVTHSARGFDDGAFDAQSLGTIPIVRLIRRIGLLDNTTLQQVEAAVRAWLAL